MIRHFQLLKLRSVRVASHSVISYHISQVAKAPTSKPNIDLNIKRPSVSASTSPTASMSKMDISSALSVSKYVNLLCINQRQRRQGS